MKVVVATSIFLLLCLFVYSQQTPKTQAELEAYIKNIQKKADSMQNAAKKKTKANADSKSAETKPRNAQTDKRGKNDNLPELDSAKVRSLPKKILSPSELNTYLNSLYSELSKRYSTEAVASANSIAQKLNNNPIKLEAAALHAWQNGAGEEAVLLITKGATVSGNDGLVLTNTGAILNMNGLSDRAIPILRTLVHHAPGNAIALNNLGQAYTALGMRDSAMTYLNRCIGLSAQHPEANATAGHIELKKGNKSGAQSYFENSIRGSFNISAYQGLATIFKDDKSKLKIRHLIKPKVKLPEYFNQFKFNNLPRHCYNVSEAATVAEEYKVYKQMLDNENRKYSLLKKEAENQMGKDWAEKMNKKTMDAVMKGESYMRPFQMLGTIIEAEANLGYSLDMADLQKFNDENREKYKALSRDYEKEMEYYQSGHHDCEKENALKNKYLPLFAQLNEEWRSRNLLIENKYIDDWLYWCYFSAADMKDYRHRFYNIVSRYLYRINFLAQVKILEPCKESEPEEVDQLQRGELSEFECPANVQIAFVVGKLSFDCEKFSFKAGELLVFRFEKKFKGNQESTISIGGGGSIDLKQELGPVKAGFEVGADMSLYFTFDKTGNCTDAGMSYSASRGIGIDFSQGERIKFNKDFKYSEEKIGWRFGINSGLGFTMPNDPFEKKETQLNKNVKIYQGQ